MQNWKEYYDERMLSLEDAAKKIESGDVIFVGSSSSAPYNMVNAVTDRHEELSNVTIISTMFLHPVNLLMDPDLKKSFKSFSMFPNVLERFSMQQGLIDVVSIPFSYCVRAFKDVWKLNTIMFEVCPPDENGYCNMTTAGTTTNKEALKLAKKKIAVVNPRQARANGKLETVAAHVSEFDWFCIDEHDMPAIPPSPPEEIDNQIAEQILKEIHDGDTLQIGMGGLPNAILEGLNGARKDLKIYTEILTDNMVDLAESGTVVSMKAGCAFGMPRLYEFCANPMVIFLNDSELGDPREIAKLEDFVSINATFMTDITGQLCSEAIGPRQYSSVGGQIDFVRGAAQAKNGRSYITLRSTRKDKEGNLHSNIVAKLPEGSIVTTPRVDAMYIVTEYGVADVYLKPIKDRIKALINIAHPQFREELKAQAIAQGNMFPDDFDS